MIIIGVDPAFGVDSYVGYCLLDDEKLLEYGSLPTAQAADTHTRFNLLKQAQILVIESQFLGTNPSVHGKLVLARAWWQVPAKDIFGMEVIEISPQEWQKAVNRGWKFGKGSKQAYDVYEDYVRKRYDLAENIKLKKDTIAAIAMATVYRDRMKQGGVK